MSSTTWTPEGLLPEIQSLEGECWRVVEAQHANSSHKLVDSLEDHEKIERLIDATKPPVPEPCQGLDYLLSTPFRYQPPHPHGSRFRRALSAEGAFYGAEEVETAIAERVFHGLLPWVDDPKLAWPSNHMEHTIFPVGYKTQCALDLTQEPFISEAALWDPVNYGTSQALADTARSIGVEVLKYPSVRDPQSKPNIAILSCSAFGEMFITRQQTWKFFYRQNGVLALRDFPNKAFEFSQAAFSVDPRVSGMNWDR